MKAKPWPVLSSGLEFAAKGVSVRIVVSKRWLICLFLIPGWLFLVGICRADDRFFGLEEVEAGQRGEWRTVAEGNELRTFQLEIIGKVPNYLGPGKDAILAKALDAEHIRSGPVAGMSGSPVYIDGRLVGAYAFGYIWPKEQAIIGITPIEHMLGLLEEGRAGDAGPAFSEEAPLRPLPTPLLAAGFSGTTLDLFREEFARFGLQPISGGGGSGTATAPRELQPGSAMAAILLKGDFSMAATGTVTHREDDRVLGFGHPFLHWGEMEVPFGGAEILTIVRNLRISFKFSNPGEPVGTLYADRTTGVAGLLGKVPAMSEISLALQPEGSARRVYKAEAFRDSRLSPLLVAAVVAEALGQSLSAERDTTFIVQAEIGIEGLAPRKVELAATGSNAHGRVAFGMMERLAPILDNPWGNRALESLHMEISATPGQHIRRVETVRTHRSVYRPGDTVEAVVELRDEEGVSSREHLALTIPENLPKDSRLELVVADADERARLAETMPRRDLPPPELLDRWAETRPANGISLLLVRRSTDFSSRGRSLPGLPPSVARQLRTSGLAASADGRTVLAERHRRTSALITGSWRTPLPLEFQ